eukprot:m.18592 g.18592  ORF g.18592 m.18592 type:complete len:237 (+) comp10134_c0_seq1:53-763(+)
MHLVRLHSMTKPSCLTHTLFILAGVHLTMSGDSSLCEKAEIALDSSGRMVLTDCHNSTTLGDVVDRIAQLENSNSANLTELQRVVAEQASTIAQLTAWMSSFDPHATAKAIKRHNQQVYSCYIDSPRVLDGGSRIFQANANTTIAEQCNTWCKIRQFFFAGLQCPVPTNSTSSNLVGVACFCGTRIRTGALPASSPTACAGAGLFNHCTGYPTSGVYSDGDYAFGGFELNNVWPVW